MAEDFVLAVDHLEPLQSFDDLKPEIRRSARIALNYAVDRGRTNAAKLIRRDINFPPSYLSPSNGRLSVKERARGDKLEASIAARVRNTSLARFAIGNPGAGGAKRGSGVRVSVTPGSVKRLPGAFLIRLRAGSADIDTKSNLGLAVRTKDGKPPPGYKPVKMADNLWLLYGPSVSQAFINSSNSGVASDVSPKLAGDIEREFWRQMDL